MKFSFFKNGGKDKSFFKFAASKNKKITVEYKNLTFATMKDPFLWGVYSPAIQPKLLLRG
jgi:hypothetical protein